MPWNEREEVGWVVAKFVKSLGAGGEGHLQINPENSRKRLSNGPQMAQIWHPDKGRISDFRHLERFSIFRVLTMLFSGLRNRLEALQSNNRRKLKTMFPVMLNLALLGALLLGLIHVLRLDRSRKRISF